MFFDRNINFFCVNDGGSDRVGQTEGLLHVAVDLKQIVADLPDFWKKKWQLILVSDRAAVKTERFNHLVITYLFWHIFLGKYFLFLLSDVQGMRRGNINNH